MKQKKASRAEILVGISHMFLDDWSGVESPYLAQPSNTDHILQTYCTATGCSFETARKRAARALLSEWKAEREG